MTKVVAFRRRTPHITVTWFETVNNLMMNNYLEDNPHTVESQTLNKFHSVAAVLCIYADKNLQIHRTSKAFLANRIGLTKGHQLLGRAP